MGRRRGWTVSAVLVAALMGCTSTIAGEAVAGDPQLDTGGYKVGPRDVPGLGGDEAIVQRNSILSDSVIVPPDLDPAFDWYAARPFPSLAGAESQNRVLGERLAATLSGQQSGVIAAFRESRADRAPTMAVLVMRFTNERAAREAFTAARALSPGGRELRPGVAEGPVPEAFAPGVAYWSQHQEYVLVSTFRDVDRARADTLAASWAEKQPARLTEKTPAWQIPPADKDGIMRYTRLDLPDPAIAKYSTGYFTGRAQSIIADGRWSTAQKSRAAFGIDLIGSAGRNQVLRAGTANLAADWVQDLTKTYGAAGADDGARLEDRIPGLPQSACYSRISSLVGSAERVYACHSARGRYIAVAHASTLTAAQQSAAAGYLTLPAG